MALSDNGLVRSIDVCLFVLLFLSCITIGSGHQGGVNRYPFFYSLDRKVTHVLYITIGKKHPSYFYSHFTLKKKWIY